MTVRHVFPASDHGQAWEGLVQAAADIVYRQFLDYERQRDAKKGF